MRTRPPATPQTPSVPNCPGRCAASPRRMSRSSHPSPPVRRSPDDFVHQLVVALERYIHVLHAFIHSEIQFTQGAKECRDVVKTVVQEKPHEECNLEPKKTCKFVTKLVPKLEPKQECVDVPKEVCATQRQNPRTVTKPLIKKWCYTPSK